MFWCFINVQHFHNFNLLLKLSFFCDKYKPESLDVLNVKLISFNKLISCKSDELIVDDLFLDCVDEDIFELDAVDVEKFTLFELLGEIAVVNEVGLLFKFEEKDVD
jgi:hypothetical protein